jgi:hypothetical protein
MRFNSHKSLFQSQVTTQPGKIGTIAAVLAVKEEIPVKGVGWRIP